MSTALDGKLVVAISSRALFDLDESNRLFENEGIEAYERYQMQHEEETLSGGVAVAFTALSGNAETGCRNCAGFKK